MKLIVMAGGQGTKLWPMSQDEKPKQFQNVIGDESLYQYTVNGLLKEFDVSDIFISTKKKYLKYVIEQTPEIPIKQIIAEPDIKKNQGPATIYAALKVQEFYPDEPFMLIQSDCIREPYSDFIKMIKQTEEIVKTTGKMISGGIRPLYPTMGVDYFKLGDRYNFEGDLDIYNVEEFIYRPGTEKKTRELVENFHVVTHTNHLCWYADKLLEATKEYRPQWYEKMLEIRSTFGQNDEEKLTEAIYAEIEDGANIEVITSHIFEKDGLIALLPYRWTDVGTWSSVYKYFAPDGGVHKDGNIIDIDSSNSYIKGNKDKLIATLGVEDLVIIDTDDVLLICNKERSSDINEVLDKIKDKK